MISSYYPPTKSSNSSTPQRSGGESDSRDTSVSPNFNSIPVNEILKSAPTRSAFLQSLQKSREREERRERERERDREFEKGSVNEADSISVSGNGNGYLSEYDRNLKTTSNLDYIESKSKQLNNYNDYNFNLHQPNKLLQPTQQSTLPSSSPITPTMTRRRISNSSSKSNVSVSNNTNSNTNNNSPTVNAPLKPLNNATPTNQSKLAVHAFTMSRSSNEDESEIERIRERERENYGGLSSEYIDTRSINYNNSTKLTATATPQRSTSTSLSTAFPVNSDDFDFKRRYEEQFFSISNSNSNVNNTTANPNVNSANTIDTRALAYQQDTKTSQFLNTSNSPNIKQKQNSIDQSQNLSLTYESVKNLIDSSLETHTISLKNDLQNLHVEIIKQSLIQQNTLQRLLETYLPLTGKLMESLEETREENLKLKKRIDELTFPRR